MTLTPCTKVPGLNLLPERCAQLYLTATGAPPNLIRCFGDTGYSSYRRIQQRCIGCPTGQERAGGVVPEVKPRGAQPGNHHRPKSDLTVYWLGKFSSEREWLLSILRQHKTLAGCSASLGHRVSWDVLRKHVVGAGIKLRKGKRFEG